MLAPDELLHISEGAEEIAEALHQDILDRIIKRIMRRIGRGDSYILTAQDKWQIEVLQDAGLLMADIQEEIAKATGLMRAEIAEAMEDAGVRSVDYDNRIYEAAGLSTAPLDQSPGLIRIAQRNYEATMGELENFTRTIGQHAAQSYVTACDRAYNLVMSGAISYSQAVKEALSEMVNDGLVVEYATRTDTIETATMRAVRTGISQASAQITDARMEEMDWDIVLTSAHIGARPGNGGPNGTNHIWWQGRFFSRTGKSKQFPPFKESTGYGTVTGLCGANCRHSFSPGDGVHNPWDEKSLNFADQRKAYEIQQRQRALENRIRKTKRSVMSAKSVRDNATDDTVMAEWEREYQRKSALLARQNAAYNQFCESNNLRKRSDRIAIAKWDRTQAAKARAAAKKWQDAHQKQERKET